MLKAVDLAIWSRGGGHKSSAPEAAAGWRLGLFLFVQSNKSKDTFLKKHYLKMHLIKKADNISKRRCVLHCVIAHLCRSFQSWRTFIPVCLFLFPPTLLFSPTTDGGKDVAGEMLNGNIEANGYHISSLHIIIWASLSCICTRACQTSFIKHKQSLLHLSLSRWLSHLLYAASPWSINRWTVEKLAGCLFLLLQPDARVCD